MNDDRLVEVYEVGPRDGLQNEASPIATIEKIALIDQLSLAGFRHIEAASFVSPKWVPQMADGADVMASIARRPGVSYAVLAPNPQGYERAKACRPDEVAVFASASEGFSRNNINCSVAESFDRFAPVCAAAALDGVALRGYVSCVVACPFDGPVSPRQVASVAFGLVAMGCREISLGDTIGAGTPETVAPMLKAVLERVEASQIACHFHDTGGRALDCIAVALELGIRVFDASAGGAGGCPYAPGSPGNVATGAVVDFLEARGLRTCIDRDALAEAEATMHRLLGRVRAA